ncbi:MAG: phosphodiester glycosidase family protein [Eubacteriales bacterium]
MKRKIIITICIVLLCLVSCQKVDYAQLKTNFDNLLIAGNYDAANTLYEAADDQIINYYQNSLDSFSASLIENATNYMPLDEAKKQLESFLVFEYTRGTVQQALDNLIASEQAIAESNSAFAEGMAFYSAREYDSAYEKLALVDAADENYHIAQSTIEAINQRKSAWQSAADTSLMGRKPFINSLAYRDGYVYFSANINNVHSIVKHNYVSGETFTFPLLQFPGTFHIRGINVVGDYIYFTAGEELGKGTMLDSPYNIYEMKTDGTGLAMVKSGDYFDLISYGDIFYALSYSKGLVKMDKYFASEEVISDKNIIEMQLTESGLYFTEKLQNNYNALHTLYKYQNGAIQEIMTKPMLHVYFFDGYSIFYNDMSEATREELFVADMNAGNEERLAILKDGKTGDMQNIIGAIGDRVFLNTSGWLQSTTNSAAMRQKLYAEITISSKRMDVYQSAQSAPDYKSLGVLYEEGVQLVLSADGVYSLSATPGSNGMEHVINIPSIDTNALDANMTIINENRPTDEDFFSDEEIIIEYDDFWYYSSPSLNVTIERIYDEEVETSIYVANIRTKELSGFSIGYSNLAPPGDYSKHIKTDDIAQVNKAVFATNGDFAMFSKNTWSGKVIREGRIFDGIGNGIKEFAVEDVYDAGVNCDDFLVMYPDGNMVAYTDKDGITYGQLLDAGVQNTLSFGPILVRDGQKTNACTDPSYYISGVNPRCAIGMVEPGHYVSLVADGRQPGQNRGMSFYSLSDYFQKLGCSVAYNLDGGQTAAMTFMGRYINTHQNDGGKWQNHRAVQEIIYFGTSELVPYDLEHYYEK